MKTIYKPKSKFTKRELNEHWYIMGTALLECSISLDLEVKDLCIYTSKIQGLYYLVGKDRDPVTDLPTTVYFKKDFR
jgi:hypothetical protein